MNLFRLRRTLKLGIRSLRLHKLRSFLTVLGIVFGVCSVIAMLAIGEGASYEAQEQIKQLGSHNIIISSVKPPETMTDSGQKTTFVVEYGLTYEDAERLAGTVPSVKIIVPSRSLRKDIWFKNRKTEGQIIGTVPWFPQTTNNRVTGGRFINGIDVRNETNVAVIGPAIARAIFRYDDPLDKTIKIGSDYYRVVGIMADKNISWSRQNSGGANINESLNVYIPISTERSRFGELSVRRASGSFSAERVELNEITVKVKELEDIPETVRIIGHVLGMFHKSKDYNITVPLELLKQAQRTKVIFNIVLGSIAAISLLVGGIGIMNIMLATVTERTREIGIRRALGARKRDIIIQFLTETAILSAIGGFIGVLIGIIIPFIIRYFAKMATIITLWSVVLSFSISVGIGIIFGLYPARRATQMDPIEALRHE